MDNYYTVLADNRGVHINSGIPNKAFYLCCLEIGIDECALIWFETLKVLWRTADFDDMLAKILETTARLTSDKSVCDSAVEAVTRSFSTVGLDVVTA
jgi:Zn-dependent metalloprotease